MVVQGKSELAFISQPCGSSRFQRIGSSVLAKLLIYPLLLLPSMVAAGGEPAGGINWSVTPYIWASDTKFDLKAGDTPIGGKLTFDDLVDTTDSSFQIVTEAGVAEGHWSVFIDLTYLDTSDDYNGQLLRVESDSEQWFIDAAIAWWPGGEKRGLSFYGGVRYTDLDDNLDFFLSENRQPLGTAKNKRDFLDGLIGVRQIFTVAERWSLLTQADYSAGESEGTYLVQALIRYGVGKNNQHGLMLGYRYKEAEFEHDEFEEEFEYKGPLIGFNLRF